MHGPLTSKCFPSDWPSELSYARLGASRPHDALLLIITVDVSNYLSFQHPKPVRHLLDLVCENW